MVFIDSDSIRLVRLQLGLHSFFKRISNHDTNYNQLNQKRHLEVQHIASIMACNGQTLNLDADLQVDAFLFLPSLTTQFRQI
jgi:hypothetical protein